jgi:hypothetical protein
VPNVASSGVAEAPGDLVSGRCSEQIHKRGTVGAALLYTQGSGTRGRVASPAPMRIAGAQLAPSAAKRRRPAQLDKTPARTRVWTSCRPGRPTLLSAELEHACCNCPASTGHGSQVRLAVGPGPVGVRRLGSPPDSWAAALHTRPWTKSNKLCPKSRGAIWRSPYHRHRLRSGMHQVTSRSAVVR